MTAQLPRRVWIRLASYAAASVAVWAAAVGALLWYLRRMVAEAVRVGAPTDADSIGLPLVSAAILLGGVLVLANAIAVVALLRRRDRAHERDAS